MLINRHLTSRTLNIFTMNVHKTHNFNAWRLRHLFYVIREYNKLKGKTKMLIVDNGNKIAMSFVVQKLLSKLVHVVYNGKCKTFRKLNETNMKLHEIDVLMESRLLTMHNS